MSILFFHIIYFREQLTCDLFSGKQNFLKNALFYINLANWLDSRFFHYKFPILPSLLVGKNDNLGTDLSPQIRLGSKIVTWFSFSKLEDTWKQENHSVKSFRSQQIWQISITKYYSYFQININFPKDGKFLNSEKSIKRSL